MNSNINIIFDFDGVILNSNNIKTRAFKKISEPFGQEFCNLLVDYHVKNGGVSRFVKIRWFVEEVLKRKDECLINELIYLYSIEMEKLFYKCQFRTDLFKLKQKLKGTFWGVASGGLETEIKHFLESKSKIKLFELGVYGSPTPKMEIIQKLKYKETFLSKKTKWFLVGDSYYDFECAIKNEIKFIFASAWSEIVNPLELINQKNVLTISGIEELNLDLLKSKF